MTARVRVLFVCLGNICRSPTAHGIFESLIEREGLQSQVDVDSAGTGGWHVGEAPDRRAAAAARERGYRLDHLRARQATPSDFLAFDYVLAMDQANLQALDAITPEDARTRARLFLEFGRNHDEREVPDPYYGGAGGFERVLDLVEDACEGLLADIRETHL